MHHPLWQHVRNEFKQGSVTTRLIYISLGLYIATVATHIVGVFVAPGLNAFQWTYLPPSLEEALQQPFSLLTFLFAHTGIFALLIHSLWLYFMGKLLRMLNRERLLLRLYLIGGCSGAVGFWWSGKDFPFVFLPGADVALFSLFAFLLLYAHSEYMRLLFFGRVRMAYIALAGLLIFSVGLPNIPSIRTAYFAASISGFCSAIFLKGFQATIGTLFKSLFQSSKTTSRPRPNGPRSPKTSSPKGINDIWEKVHKSGYESLTAEEKRRLFKGDA